MAKVDKHIAELEKRITELERKVLALELRGPIVQVVWPQVAPIQIPATYSPFEITYTCAATNQ